MLVGVVVRWIVLIETYVMLSVWKDYAALDTDLAWC